MTTLDPALHEPRYSPAEAARLIGGISADTVRRWLGSPATGKGDVVLRERQTNWASFLDLVELYIATQLKRRLNISTRRLKAKLRDAAKRKAVDHPLATRSFLIDGPKLWLPMPDGVLDLDEGGQLGLEQVVRDVAVNIDFDVEGLAERWWPRGKDGGVVVDPRIAFGDPTVPGTRVNTAVLYELWLAEDRDTAAVADAYGLEAKRIEYALSFEEERRAA